MRNPEHPFARSFRRIVLVILELVAAATAVREAAAEVPPDFVRDVLPILKRSCLECHGTEHQKGGLRLDTKVGMLKGGDSGPVVVPGKVVESELFRRISLAKDDPKVMPARGPLLSKEQVAALRAWVEQGAVWPEKFAGSTHWAYIRPTRPPLPTVKNSVWPRNEIDRFLLARLEREGLTPSPEADRTTLIRRLSLDLTGLPPSPTDVDAFLADDRSDAYEHLAERLLASPQFGERWARPWLDLARYADSHGFQRDDLRDVWAYRDWVIEALNADMPFDRFTIEQLAGDLLPGASESQRIATGFHRCATTNVEAGTEPEETRVNQVIDRVNTTAAIWLGSTLECAQCHDHKYDPFTQRDYYRLFAFFNNTAIEAERSKPTAPGSIRFIGPEMALRDPVAEVARERLSAEIEVLQRRLDERGRELAEHTTAFESELAMALRNAPRTHIVDAANFESSAGAPYKVLEDKSILLVDDAPDKDTYTVRFQTRLTGISGFKLEALTDPSLPGMGPGRSDASNPDFELNTFTVTASSLAEGADFKPVVLRNARASYSQMNYDVAGAIDDDPRTAWGIHSKSHEAHWATFETELPLGSEEGIVLAFTLVQESGGGKTIGRLRLSLLTGDPHAKSIPADVASAFQTPADQRTAEQRQRLLDYQLEQDATGSKLKNELATLRLRRQAIKLPTTLVMQEAEQSRPTHVFLRGDYQAPGEPVEAGVPGFLPPLAPPPDGRMNRLALAGWLVSRDNPLTARVVVNRWWAEIFGRGIVGTVEDFGVKGEAPTHPELLDWLAVEFADNNWSMKRLLFKIVTSAAYRQSSRMTPESLARDPDNRFCARGPRFRLEAEAIRDNALAAAGLLSLKAGGPPVRPFQPDGLWTKVGGAPLQYVTSPGDERYRRGIYVVWKRSALYPSFVNFDATSRLVCLPRRSRTNTPLQALTLLNDPVYVEVALALAQRVVAERPAASVDERIRHAFRLCLVREPTAAEGTALARLYRLQRDAGLDNPQAAQQLIGGPADSGQTSAVEMAAWHSVATALLNLDETITKD